MHRLLDRSLLAGGVLGSVSDDGHHSLLKALEPLNAYPPDGR
jgi:hypothetical protein